MQPFHLELLGQHLILDPMKVIFWEEASMLILSDLHLGKAGHFRKHGIAVPGHIHSQDLSRLDFLIKKYQPEKIAFIGDLFHSDINSEWHSFIQWMDSKPVKMLLVKGNHDVLTEEIYHSSNMELYDELIMDPFHFSHKKRESSHFNISGHVHPAVRLRGRAKQGLTVPCFYFSKGFGLLPAYGVFTGTYKIRPTAGDMVFATTGEEVIALMP